MKIKKLIILFAFIMMAFGANAQIPLLGNIQPGNELDTYPVFLTEHGYGTIKQVESYIDLYAIPNERLVLGNLATVSDSGFRVYQLMTFTPVMRWEPLVGTGGISDSPSDGTPYSRQDAGWVSASSGSGNPVLANVTTTDTTNWGTNIVDSIGDGLELGGSGELRLGGDIENNITIGAIFDRPSFLMGSNYLTLGKIKSPEGVNSVQLQDNYVSLASSSFDGVYSSIMTLDSSGLIYNAEGITNRGISIENESNINYTDSTLITRGYGDVRWSADSTWESITVHDELFFGDTPTSDLTIMTSQGKGHLQLEYNDLAGNNNTPNARESLVIGSFNTFPNITGSFQRNLIVGVNNSSDDAYFEDSYVHGLSNTGNYNQAFIKGNNNIINSGGVFVNGDGNNISSTRSFTVGLSLYNITEGQVALGRYGEDKDNLLFSLSNGTSTEDRNNIFEIDITGKVFTESIQINTGDTLFFGDGTFQHSAASTGGISDAPSDGTPYSRQDAGWVSASSGNPILADVTTTDTTNWGTQPTGLEQITEGGNTGYRLMARDSSYYGNIGENATDLSYSSSPSLYMGATGRWSYTEGVNTQASGDAAHAEGAGFMGTPHGAIGNYSHVEGLDTKSVGLAAHAEGISTIANREGSHAEGYYTIAQNINQHSAGRYNVGTSTTTIHETGIGVNSSGRANAFEIHTDGRVIAPELSIIKINSDKSLITKEYFEANTSSGSSIIDWTLASQGTIHATNYVDNNTQLSDGEVGAFGYIKSITETDPIWISDSSTYAAKSFVDNNYIPYAGTLSQSIELDLDGNDFILSQPNSEIGFLEDEVYIYSGSGSVSGLILDGNLTLNSVNNDGESTELTVGSSGIDIVSSNQTFRGVVYNSIVSRYGDSTLITKGYADNNYKAISDSIYTPSVTTTRAIDFSNPDIEKFSIDANFTFSSTGLQTRSVTKSIYLTNGSSVRTLLFPATWLWVGAEPTQMSASEVGILTVQNFGNTDADVVASYVILTNGE